MVTREQILEIQSYCAEHGITQGARLDELHINRSRFYRWQRKYREEDEQGDGKNIGSFVQLTPGGSFISSMMPPARTSSKARPNKGTADDQSFLTIEMRTSSGLAIRIQGGMTPAHLKELIAAGNVQS